MTLDAVRPYPDELLTSALVRVCRHYHLTMATLGQHFLGRVKWHPRFVSIPAIAPMQDLFGIDGADLLWRHTVFPYATAFLDPTTFARAQAVVKGPTEVAAHGALAQNAIVATECWRFCVQCLDEDMFRWGESYWRRSHNLPGVYVCNAHRVFLHDTDLPVALASRAPLVLPHETKGASVGRRRPPPTLVQISLRSAQLLHRAPGPPISWSADGYRRLAQENGWLASSADLSSAALSKLIASKCGRDFTKRTGLTGTGAVQEKWAPLVLRPGSQIPFVPLKHIVLDTVLGTPRSAGDPELTHRSKGPPGTDDAKLDRYYSAQASRLLRGVLATGETGLTTDAFLRRIGCLGAYRHRGESLPLLRDVVFRFRSSPASVKQLAPGRTLYRKPPPQQS